MENNRAPTPNPNRVSRMDYAEFFPKGTRVTPPSEDDGAQARAGSGPNPTMIPHYNPGEGHKTLVAGAAGLNNPTTSQSGPQHLAAPGVGASGNSSGFTTLRTGNGNGDNAEAFPTFNPPPITDQAANTLPAPAQQVTTQPTATTGVQPAADAKAVDVVIPPQMMMPAPVNTQPLTTVVLPSSRPSRVKKVWTKAKRAAKALKPTKAINVLKGLGGKISNVLRGKKSKH